MYVGVGVGGVFVGIGDCLYPCVCVLALVLVKGERTYKLFKTQWKLLCKR